MKGLKRKIALLMAVVLSVSTLGQSGAAVFAAEIGSSDDELVLYDKDKRSDLDADEIAKAKDINVLVDSEYEVTDVHDGIEFYEDKVAVSYYEDKGSFDLSKTGKYETYYKVEPYSGKKPGE